MIKYDPKSIVRKYYSTKRPKLARCLLGAPSIKETEIRPLEKWRLTLKYLLFFQRAETAKDLEVFRQNSSQSYWTNLLSSILS